MATDRTGDDGSPESFSWLDPHLQFCIIIVGGGPDTDYPFGMHKDLLAAKSTWFRKYFADKEAEKDQVELVLNLPGVKPAVFGLAQQFLYTQNILIDGQHLAQYDVLIDLWKLGDEFGIAGLCDEAIEAMKQNREFNNSIPSVDLLIRVWKDVPEGSSLRKLLIKWTAEYIRLSEARSEFTKQLPKELLSELVIAMSDLPSLPAVKNNSSPQPPVSKNVHYLDDEEDDDEPREAEIRVKKQRKARPSDPQPSKPKDSPSVPAASKSSKAKRPSLATNPDVQYPEKDKLLFCSDLLARMLSGPSWWTRHVGPFRDPVKPAEDNVPDYLEKVKRPMDLNTIRNKMDSGGYETAEQFEKDVNQIIENCYTYWGREHPMSRAATNFGHHFEGSYNKMYKWLGKLTKAEEDV